MGNECSMIKKMGGDRRQWEYPVLILEEEIGVTNLANAEIMAKSFTKIHSSENLSEEERRRSVTLNQSVHALNKKEETGSIIDEIIYLAELVKSINRAKPTSPGKDQVCYVMLKHLRER